jgi:hypothetical protein
MQWAQADRQAPERRAPTISASGNNEVLKARLLSR